MLLAVDTSNAQIGLAVYDGSMVIGEMAWRGGQRHTVELAPAIQNLLDRCRLHMEDLDALGIAIGPGSFTSLRVGLALVKGLALAKKIPLIGIPTLDILAQAQPLDDRPLGIAIQAGRKRFALGWYRDIRNQWQAEADPRIVTLEELKDQVKVPSVICGEFTAADRQAILENKYVQLSSPADAIRRPSVLAQLAWGRWQRGETDDAASLAPIYLHTAAPIET